MIAMGIGLSVVAATCYALAAALQHGAVRDITGPGHTTERVSLRRLGSLLLARRWLLGLVAMGLGASLHVVALAMAPLVVVQPIGVLGIGLTVVFSRFLGRGARLDRRTALAVLACTAGVGLFVLVAARRARDTVVSGAAALHVLPVTGGLVVILIVAALASRGWTRTPLFATAAGVAYGTVSVLMRAVTRQFREAGLAGVSIPAVLGVLLAIVIAAWCVQQAYAGGRADTVLSCETVVDPLVGVLLGVLLFHEAGPVGPLAVVTELAGAALAVAGVVTLARRPVDPEPAVLVTLPVPARIPEPIAA